MAMSVNTVSITGNLTRDAEHRATASGTEMSCFTVAVNDQFRKPDGAWEERANFVDCRLFGPRASSLTHYLTRGTKVAVQGKLRYSSWQGKDGARRAKLEVVVDELDFMSARPEGAPQPPRYPIVADSSSTAGSSSQGYESIELADEDIAF